jgi:hypothetical protein
MLSIIFATMLRMFHVPLGVFIPFLLGILLLFVGIRDYKDDDENGPKVRRKQLYKEIAKAILMMLLSVFIWLVFY